MGEGWFKKNFWQSGMFITTIIINRLKSIFQCKYLAVTIIVLSSSCKKGSEQRHYESYKAEIEALITYFSKIVPQDKIIEIEFIDDNHLDRLQITDIDTIWVKNDSFYLSSYPQFSEWDIYISKDIPDSILSELNWNKQTFKTLKSKLDAAGCISINNESPIILGHKRNLLGMTSYYVYKKTDPNTLKQIKNASTELHFFCDSVAWYYDTGAL